MSPSCAIVRAVPMTCLSVPSSRSLRLFSIHLGRFLATPDMAASIFTTSSGSRLPAFLFASIRAVPQMALAIENPIPLIFLMASATFLLPSTSVLAILTMYLNCGSCSILLQKPIIPRREHSFALQSLFPELGRIYGETARLYLKVTVAGHGITDNRCRNHFK